MRLLSTAIFIAVTASSAAFAGNHDPRAIAALLPQATLTLLEGIKISEATNGPATSAKFEIDDENKLILSVYNIPEGLDVEPEAATLMEVTYVATDRKPVGTVAVFTDKEHIARAAAHMVLFKLSPLSLSDVLNRAVTKKAGIPIDVRNPNVRAGRAVAEVVLIGANGEPSTILVDLLAGTASVK